MKLKKCPKCQDYSLGELCKKCKSPTKDAHYRYVKIRNSMRKE